MYKQVFEFKKAQSVRQQGNVARFNDRVDEFARRHSHRADHDEIQPARPQNGNGDHGHHHGHHHNGHHSHHDEFLVGPPDRTGSSSCVDSNTREMEIARKAFERVDSKAREMEIARKAFERKQARSKKRYWILQKVFGIGPSDSNYVGSKLIHPGSPFGQFVVFVTTFMLLYVAIVTPVTIGFYWFADPCDKSPLQPWDMAMDCWFLAEILMNFFVGTFSPQGMYIDELKIVSWKYFKQDFAFDMATSIPVAIIEYFSQLACSGGGEATVPASQLRIVRATKPLRIFKMLRMLKTSKLLIVLDYLEQWLRPPPFMTRMLRMLFGIFMIVHICACLFWLVKESAATDAELQWFLDDNLLPHDASLIDKYLLAAYFVNTVFTTVGFGDIAATNAAERVFTVIIMYVGTLVFGTMLGEVQNAMAQLRKNVRERSAIAQDVKDYLRDNQTPRHIEKNLMDWIQFNEDCRQKQATRCMVWDRFPMVLKRQLATHLQDQGTGDSLLGMVAVFGDLEHRDRHDFLLDLYMQMESETFGRALPIAKKGDKAERLFFIRQGAVHVTPTEEDGPNISTLIAPDHFGEYALFEDTVWEESYWTDSFVECWTLTRQAFQDVLAHYDEKLEEELGNLAEAARTVREDTAWIKDQPRLARWRTLLLKVKRKVRRSTMGDAAEKLKKVAQLASFKLSAGVRKRGGSGERRLSFTLAPSTRASSAASSKNISPTPSLPGVEDDLSMPDDASISLQRARGVQDPQSANPQEVTKALEALASREHHENGLGSHPRGGSLLGVHRIEVPDMKRIHGSQMAQSTSALPSLPSGSAAPSPTGSKSRTEQHTLLSPSSDVTRMLKKILDGQHKLEAQVSGLTATMEVVRSDLHRTHMEVATLIKSERRDSMIWKRRKSLDAGQAMTEAAAAVGLQSRSQRNSDASSQEGDASPTSGVLPDQSPLSMQFGSFVSRAPTKLRPASPGGKRRQSMPVVDASLVYDPSVRAASAPRRASSERANVSTGASIHERLNSSRLLEPVGEGSTPATGSPMESSFRPIGDVANA